MAKRWMGLLIVVVVLVAVGGVVLWLSRARQNSRNELVLFGNVDIRQTDLAFRVSERITSMQVQEGDRVEKGQLLAAVRKDRFEATVQQAEAQADAQAQVVARLEAGSRPEEIRQAQAEYAAAQADANNAVIRNRRMQSLVSEDATSQQNADDARAQAETAAAKLQAAKEALDLVIAGPRKEDIAAARATLEALKAQLALARRDLADANLCAPTAGVIRNRILEPGDIASPATPVYTMALTEPLWVRAYVPETDLGKIRLGMAAEVTTDSYPGKVYEAWVGFISPTAEFTPKSVETPDVRTSLVYQVRIFVRNPEDELRLGMPATVTIALPSDRAAD